MILQRISRSLFTSIKAPIESIKKLRAETSAPVGQCKQALEESENDYKEALGWLKKKGMLSADKISGKQTRQGVIACALNSTRDKAVLMEVNCETDFVAENQLFLRFVEKLRDRVLDSDISFNVDGEQYGNEAVDKFLHETKPCDIFPEEQTNKNLQEQFKLVIARLQENIRIRRVITLHSDQGAKFGHYVHQANCPGIGSQVSLTEFRIDPELSNNDEYEIFQQFSDNMSAQVLGSPPKYLTPEQIPEQQLQDEADKVREQMAAALAKAPEHMHDKMVAGKLNANYYSQVLLTSMDYIMATEGQSVGDYWGVVEHELGKTIDIVKTMKWECK